MLDRMVYQIQLGGTTQRLSRSHRARVQEAELAAQVEIAQNIKACELALVTRAHDFLTSTDSEVFLRGARAFTLQHPPVQRTEDVSEPIEDLSDLTDEQLDRMRAVRDAARSENEQGQIH